MRPVPRAEAGPHQLHTKVRRPGLLPRRPVRRSKCHLNLAALSIRSCQTGAFAPPRLLVDAEDDDTGEVSQPDGFVELVTTPYAGNRNLAAQRGVHLLYRLREAPRLHDTVRRDPFDDALQRVYRSAKEHTKALYKLELDPSQAGHVLPLLWRYGVTGATVFPGFDGVSRALWEEDQWLP